MKDWLKENKQKSDIGKIVVCLVLISIIYLSGFDKFELTNNNLILCGLLILLVISADLAEFNVWGFKGKSKLISESTGNLSGDSINPETDNEHVDPVELAQPLNLMHPDIGNFLAITFEIEKLLRIYAENLGMTNAKATTMRHLVEFLYKEEVITNVGNERLDSVIKLRNLIVHGRSSEVDESDLQIGFELANNFYQELYATMFGEQKGDTE